MANIWQSKKFKALLLTIVVEALIPWATHAGYITTDTQHYLMLIVGAVSAAYLGAQGLTDMGKEAKKNGTP